MEKPSERSESYALPLDLKVPPDAIFEAEMDEDGEGFTVRWLFGGGLVGLSIFKSGKVILTSIKPPA